MSQRYVKALGAALDDGVKFLYVASLDDQVVPVRHFGLLIGRVVFQTKLVCRFIQERS